MIYRHFYSEKKNHLYGSLLTTSYTVCIYGTEHTGLFELSTKSTD